MEVSGGHLRALSIYVSSYSSEVDLKKKYLVFTKISNIIIIGFKKLSPTT
tara:strand:- start:186 stop:335 length:150 start_codon:yes stop_codon:yes gene_type:complete